ncbi:hypothetical protein H6P81_000879 [Aristolochia fimbriata]|uniref:General transcription factor 3C polypeptide 5 n=1 Tax=Aristolochia fimbriata TaxID=158543 RepID=A0AAV7F8H5_ARIFI|nr:hypothetical protein H6P81_000879 [Aristolochia fimbriata]
MGLIKDGTVSGVLPEATAFAVHYPGYPSSTSRAIETLGGIDEIAQARSSRPCSLELRFRPEDPYSHPAFGELRSCSNLLLRISKSNANSEQTSTTSQSTVKSQSNTQSKSVVGGTSDIVDAEKGEEESPAQVSAEIVARISEAYHFDGMVDYQYVPAVHAEEARRKRPWAEAEPDFDKVGLSDIDQDNIMLLVPPFFTLKDIPENLVLRPCAALHAKQKLEGVVQHHWEMDIEPCLAINFDIKDILIISYYMNWESHIPQGSGQWELQMVVSKLFDERPIWPKRSVQERLVRDGLKVSDDLLKRLLFRAAYYFSKGPFGHFWIRKGYDPRKNSESRMYQRIEFRIPHQLRKSGDMTVLEELKPSWRDICEFRAFPSKSFSSLQLFELADDYIRQEIRKPVEQSMCTIQTGWFSKACFHCLKLRVSVRFYSIFPRTSAADLLKAACDSFEKSKRLQVLSTDSRHGDREHQHVNKEAADQPSRSPVIRSVDVEVTCNDDNIDGEEENDHELEEEEEEEKEYDEFGLSNVGAGDMDFSLEEGSYPVGENIPNNYLQEILGGLSFTKDNNETGDELHEADMNDGVYQIYEQDSEDEDDYADDYGDF